MNRIVRQLNPLCVWVWLLGAGLEDGETGACKTGAGLEDGETGACKTGAGLEDGETGACCTGAGLENGKIRLVETMWGTESRTTRGFVMRVCLMTGAIVTKAESNGRPTLCFSAGGGGAVAITGAHVHSYEQ